MRLWYATKNGVIFTAPYATAQQVREIAKYGNEKDPAKPYGYTWRVR